MKSVILVGILCTTYLTTVPSLISETRLLPMLKDSKEVVLIVRITDQLGLHLKHQRDHIGSPTTGHFKFFEADTQIDPRFDSETMPSYRDALPAWLNNAYTESHISLALQTLAERESRREYIRSLSHNRARALSNPLSGSEASHSSSPREPVPSPHLEHYSIAVANQVHNLPCNRYADVAPYDRTRVIVGSGGTAGRYLNANWVLECYGHKWWIATQAPLPTTAHTFLSLIMQPISTPKALPTTSTLQLEGAAASYDTTRIRTVVQLTKNNESGRMKAHPYFPTEVGKSVMVSPDPELSAQALKVTLLHTQNHGDAQCLQSTVAISPVNLTSAVQTQTTPLKGTNGDESQDRYGVEEDYDNRVIFQHLMYTAWPDHGVPEDEDRTSLLAFLKLVDRLNKDLTISNYPPTVNSPPIQQRHYDPDPPILVGCSAGIGRTGSFIALSSLLRHNGFLPPAVTPTPASVIPSSPLGALPAGLAGDLVVNEIDFLREQRPRMVERSEQTLLIYELLIRTFLGA